MNIVTTFRAAHLALALLFLTAVCASAETVTGTVQTGGKAMAGVVVRVLELDRIQRTGAQGQFSFPDVPKGTYRVFAGVIGYASQIRTVEVGADGATVAFDLTESAIPMEEIVVSASPIARPADEAAQPVESRTRTDLGNSAGMSFSEKISDLPGVNVRSLGSAPSRPVLRGLSDNEVLVLENGLRMGDLATFDPAHATPVEAIGISQIDVVRGPASILYGPNTIGGLVNVLTNVVPTVSNRRISGTAAIEGNTVSDQMAGYLNTVWSGKHSALGASVGGVHTQDIRIPKAEYIDPATGTAFDLERIPQSFDHSSEFGAGYTYQSNFGSIGFGGKHYDMNYGIPGVPPNDDWANVPPSTSRIEQSRSTFELRSLLNGGGSFAKQWKVNAGYNDYSHAEFPTAQDASGVFDEQANHFHKKEFNGSLQIQHQPWGQFHGTIGVWADLEHLRIEGDQPLGPNSKTTGLAGYLFEEYMKWENTRLQAGLRYDYNHIQTEPDPNSTDSTFQTLDESRNANAVTASLGTVHTFRPGLVGSFSVARSFRAPTVQELFANGPDDPSGTFTIGSADLKPETGLGVDASLKVSGARYAVEISPFLNYINDHIYGFLRGDTLDALPVRQFAATNARLEGFEASVNVAPIDHFAILAVTDYVYAQDTELDVPLPFTPPLRGVLRGTYQGKLVSGMIEGRFADRQTRLGDGDTPTAGWGIMNLGVGLRMTHGGLVHDIGLHCDNVFDRDYRDHLSVIKDFLPQPGRAFRLNYELLF